MKKQYLNALAISAVVFSLSLPALAIPREKKTATKELSLEAKMRIDVLTARLTTIKDMDRSSMTAADKKTMRKEVRSIEKEMKELSGGVYLSVAAIIIIILILILVL